MSESKWRNAHLRPEDVQFREVKPEITLRTKYEYHGAEGVPQKGEVVKTSTGSLPARAGIDYIVKTATYITVMTKADFKAKYQEDPDLDAIKTVLELIPPVRNGKMTLQEAMKKAQFGFEVTFF